MSTIILGIESSCDDTSAAIIKDGILLSNVIASQSVHEEYGGVVPELASRAHQQNIVPVVDTAIKRAGIRYRKAYQSRHTYACWSLSAGANPSFIASQMGHASAQMVFNVYGAWMTDSNAEQIAMLNQKLADYVPMMSHSHQSDTRGLLKSVS